MRCIAPFPSVISAQARSLALWFVVQLKASVLLDQSLHDHPLYKYPETLMSTFPNQSDFFQDLMHGNHCFGCGAWNDKGLQIKSFWEGEESVCIFTPSEHHSAMPPDVMNGGIIAAVIDCHCVCTSIADAYRRDGREIGQGATLWYATAALTVRYVRPTPVAHPVTVRAHVTDVGNRKTVLKAQMFDGGGTLTADGEVVSVRVPLEWSNPTGLLK